MYIPVIVLAPPESPPGREDKFQRRRYEDKQGGGKLREMQREGRRGVPAAEKYSRFLQPPLPLSWARLWWKARDKTWRENPFSSRPCCSVSPSKGCSAPYISLCARRLWTKGRFGCDTSLFSAWCSSQRVTETGKPGRWFSLWHLLRAQHSTQTASGICERRGFKKAQSRFQPQGWRKLYKFIHPALLCV